MTGINTAQLKRLIVIPALTALGGERLSDSAVNLVTGTALAESGAAYLRQVTNGDRYGPAVSLWQMEEATHNDIWTHWLRFPAQSQQATAIRAAIGGLPAVADVLIYHLLYGAMMCREHYRRVSEALPSANDARALSLYHKRHYNTPSGKADPIRNIPLFQQAIDA